MASGEIVVDRPALATWLAETLGVGLSADMLVITRPSGGGWSNDTLFVDLPAGPYDRVVVRLAPLGPAMFPSYDLSRQIAVMRHLATRHIPVPAVLADDSEGKRLGRPAFVMAYIAGRIPVDDRPSFAEQGFLHDADPGDQRTFHVGLLDAVAAIHETDPAALPTVSLNGVPGARAALDDLRTTWDFDRGDRWAQTLDHALELLAAHVPNSHNDVLLWGDARPANLIVDHHGFLPIALLDWELASVGPPELDVTWLAEMNRMRMQGSGVAPLPGFLTDDEAIAHYERRTSRVLSDLGWYTLYSAARESPC